MLKVEVGQTQNLDVEPNLNQIMNLKIEHKPQPNS